MGQVCILFFCSPARLCLAHFSGLEEKKSLPIFLFFPFFVLQNSTEKLFFQFSWIAHTTHTVERDFSEENKREESKGKRTGTENVWGNLYLNKKKSSKERENKRGAFRIRSHIFLVHFTTLKHLNCEISTLKLKRSFFLLRSSISASTLSRRLSAS